ncbi:MAG: phosphoribosyltransferase [Parcubacteria group bacterium]|nr:phosphoribosyltransferase [Parcubacteria group bacterium]
MYETEKWVVYEHDDFYKDIELLVKKLTEYWQQPNQLSLLSPIKFDGIYGIPAGGLVLAVYLHYRLKLPLLLAPTKNSLVIDDIVDTGFTMSHYISKGNFTLALFCKEGGRLKPNIWLRKKYDKWVRFPWEGEEEYAGLSDDYKSPWEKMEGGNV